MWQGRIFKPIFICNNAGAPCCQSSGRQVGNAAGGNRNTRGSVLKGPVDLLMLPHLKVVASPHPQQRHRRTKPCACWIFACLFVSLKSWITPGYDGLPLRQEVDPTYFHAPVRTPRIAGRSHPCFREIKDGELPRTRVDYVGIQSRGDRWRSRRGNQKYSCHFFPPLIFIFIFFYSGNITCKWEANNRMERRPFPTKQAPALLEVSFPNHQAATPFLLLLLFVFLIGEKNCSRLPRLLVFIRSCNNFLYQMQRGRSGKKW